MGSLNRRSRWRGGWSNKSCSLAFFPGLLLQVGTATAQVTTDISEMHLQVPPHRAAVTIAGTTGRNRNMPCPFLLLSHLQPASCFDKAEWRGAHGMYVVHRCLAPCNTETERLRGMRTNSRQPAQVPTSYWHFLQTVHRLHRAMQTLAFLANFLLLRFMLIHAIPVDSF